jgi:hypothetical protein
MTTVVERFYYFVERAQRFDKYVVRDLCESTHTNRGNWITGTKNQKRSIIRADWLTYAVNNLNANPLWLLTGRGPMELDKKSPPTYAEPEDVT